MNETRNIIASLEFGEKESQICYYDRKEKNPVSPNVPKQISGILERNPNIFRNMRERYW